MIIQKTSVFMMDCAVEEASRRRHSRDGIGEIGRGKLTGVIGFP
jgi:hypothetical protein